MQIDLLYSKVRKRVRKALLSVLESTYENEKLDAIEQKLIVTGCKELVGAYGGGFIPDKAYEAVAKEITKLLDKVNKRLQERLRDE